MPFYRYKAVSKEGKEITAIEEALSKSHLKSILSSKGLIPVEIEEIEGRKDSKFKKFFRKKGVSQEEIAFLLYEIGILLEKNVHITQIFEILAGQTSNQELKKALLTIKTSVQEGSSISDAFRKAGVFPQFLVEMVEAGEHSGALDKIFLSASRFLEEQEEFRRKVLNALIYPSVVVFVGFIATAIIMTYVVPSITKIYSQLGRELPLSTRMIIFVSDVFTVFFKILPFLLVLSFLGWKKIIKREIVDSLKLKIPFFSKVSIYSYYSNWSNTLSLLLSGGLTLDKALDIANKTLDNSVLRNRFNLIIEEVRKGKSLSDLLTEKRLLPENSIQLIKIGEETGQLDRMLELISKIYKKHTERLITVFLSYLEPAVLIVLSVFIGFFVFATLLPIFSLNIK
ncbi:type IV pilus assembly protein PilC [Persephonella hydrogeniphila]|uniref:Type IV pilus assembly protein PilC n=1 Tax=Persephonella hydrogeniphila TaxID=198703 RepID=A0A285NAI7_9AQUI|nr:type II secretion system F family protein [Persephonella hydrogeniphila]SNZ06450.1 type IV pilus assembly protein PilC [Persephonella hydrogeniphila]